MVDLSNYALDHIPNYENITEIPRENLDYLNSGLVASDMSYMFDECNDLKTIPKLNIDTSQCANMSSMFRHCHALISLDLSNFDTSNVTYMDDMFGYCYSLTTIDLSNFDTSNVTYMTSMFYRCQLLTSLDLSNWDTSKVTDMRYMFYLCNSLEHIEGIIDMKSCANYGGMFIQCPKLSAVKIKNPPADFESETKLNSSQYEIVS